MTQEKAFLLLINGHIESAEFPEIPSICVKYSMSYGPDWKHVAGSTEGLSATCFRPQLVFSCYGNDLFGHDVVRGYGALPIPTIPGSGKRASSWSTRAQIRRGQSTHATRVTTQGKLVVRVDVILKDMGKFGFQTVPRRGLPSHEPPAADLSGLRTREKKSEQKRPVEEREVSTPAQSDDKVVEEVSPALPSEDIPRPLPTLED
ncbi:B9 protein [Ostertagia ostertagi]